MYHKKPIISVYNLRVAVSRYVKEADGFTIQPASNWEELEEDALREVENQDGARNLSGHYACSGELAARAVFVDTLLLTSEELELLLDTVGKTADLLLDMSTTPGDANDVLHTRLCALENELLWQQAHKSRRPQEGKTQ